MSEQSEKVIDEVVDEVVSKKEVSVMQRLLARTVFLATLSALGFWALDLLELVGREHLANINQQVPELMLIIRAASVLVWVELCLLWTRVLVSPQLDVQLAAKLAMRTPSGAAAVYMSHNVVWLARILLFLHLCGQL